MAEEPEPEIQPEITHQAEGQIRPNPRQRTRLPDFPLPVYLSVTTRKCRTPTSEDSMSRHSCAQFVIFTHFVIIAVLKVVQELCVHDRIPQHDSVLTGELYFKELMSTKSSNGP